MNLITRILSRYTWRWIGTVEGPTELIDGNGERIPGWDRRCYWNLYERGDGKRKDVRVGRQWGSALSLLREAEVRAWVGGGPLPTLYDQAAPRPSPKPKGKATLVVLDGGKGAK